MIEGILDLRNRIDECDAELLDILAKRLQVVSEVKILKQNFLQSDVLYIDPTREYELLSKNINLGDILDIDSKVIKIIWRGIIANANLHEQQKLCIFYSNSINDDMLLDLHTQYPIEQVMIKFTASEINTTKLTPQSIICLHYTIDAGIIDFLHENNYYVFNILETNSGDKILIFGKIDKLYKQSNGIFIFLDILSSKVIFVDSTKYQDMITNSEYKFIGSSAPII